jgi:hypothetical protein
MTMYLYRKVVHTVTLATAIVILSVSLQAQYRPPQAERKTPRAVAVLETYKNGTRRLVPVTFFYEKHYYDANFYHATPVPFTLYSETIYEVEQFGKPLGTFTVQSATQQNSAEWFGNGKFKMAVDPALLAKKKPAPVVVEDPSKPVLHRHEGSEGDNPSPHPAAASAPEAPEDPDRPKLHRRDDSGSSTTASAPAGEQTPTTAKAPTAATAPASEPAESSGQDPDRPKLHRKDDSSPDTSASTTTSTTPNAKAPTVPPSAAPGAIVTLGAAEPASGEDPDHPVLRRGKPVQEQSGRNLPDFKKEEPVSRQIAVSDAGTSELQPLVYVCREDERRQIEDSARELARAELVRLSPQRGIELPPAAKSASAKPGATKQSLAKQRVAKTSGKPETFATSIAFEDEQFVPYDLDYSNYATVVFSARYALPTAQVIAGKHKTWVVTVIARREEAGTLKKLYSSLSDPRELDLYPEVRLVDALDPDGYGRAALLFREQKRDGVSWLLGRVTGNELQPIFETTSR